MLDPDIARMLQAMQDNGEPPLFKDATPDQRPADAASTMRATLLPAGAEGRRPHRRAVHPRPGRRHPGPGVLARGPHRRNGRLLPRRRLDHRRPRLPRRPRPPAGRHRRGRGGARGLPPRPRAPVPGRATRTAWQPPSGPTTTSTSSAAGPTGSRVAGDSAGGNLAASVALHCRDTGDPAGTADLPASTSPPDWPSPTRRSIPPADSRPPGRIRPHDSDDDGFFTGQDDWVERQYLADDLSLATRPAGVPAARRRATPAWPRP